MRNQNVKIMIKIIEKYEFPISADKEFLLQCLNRELQMIKLNNLRRRVIGLDSSAWVKDAEENNPDFRKLKEIL